MAIDLTTLFGNEIKVHHHPRQIQRQFTAYAGAHGMTSLAMGTRGHIIEITGTFRVYGATYNAAQQQMITAFENIEILTYSGAQSYTYRAATYNNAVFHNFRILQLPGGKQFAYTTEGYMIARFSIQLVVHL